MTFTSLELALAILCVEFAYEYKIGCRQMINRARLGRISARKTLADNAPDRTLQCGTNCIAMNAPIEGNVIHHKQPRKMGP